MLRISMKLFIILMLVLPFSAIIMAQEEYGFHPLPRHIYYSGQTTSTPGQAGRRTARFFTIMVGSFPVAYLITTPIVVVSTNNSDWTVSQKVGLITGVAAGTALTVALIDLIIDLIQGNKPLDELSP